MVVEQSIKLLPIILDIVTDSILAEEYRNANGTMTITNSKFTIPSSGIMSGSSRFRSVLKVS